MSLAATSVSQPLLSDETFASFQQLISRLTGIKLSDAKRFMFVNRVVKRLSELQIDSFEDYLEVVLDSNSVERAHFINAITTNLTYFFREPHHFDLIKEKLFPSFAKNKSPTDPIRVWSAGCSSGQEPYSLAIAAMESREEIINPVKILCTDIDSEMVARTRDGRYNSEELRGLESHQIDRWFKKTGLNTWEADDSLKKLLVCKQLNLFDDWPFKKNVDVIMCRNVLIYFDAENQKKILKKYSDFQQKGSYLIIGHSETPDGMGAHYKRIANTVFERL
ncbi:MAG: protein-glutamate O-methyltransferase CheR [Granulosicoccus sp.]